MPSQPILSRPPTASKHFLPQRGAEKSAGGQRGTSSAPGHPATLSAVPRRGTEGKRAVKPLLSSLRSLALRLTAITILFGTAANSPAAEAPDFARHIAPLFQQHCLDCHAKQDLEGGLVLEDHASLLKGGDSGPAIVPGKSSDSRLVKFLEGRSGKEGKNQFMPPGKKKHLDPAEIALIKSWIDAGAKAPAAPTTASLQIPKITPKTAPARSITALAFSASAKLLAAGRYGEIDLLDATTRQVLRTLPGHRGTITALAFSADGTQLFAAAGDPGLVGEVRQWNLADPAQPKLLRAWDAHPDALYALALAPDGQTLATGSYDQRIKLWDTANGAERRTLKGHNGAVFGLAFRPDGRVLASASADRTVKLWDPATGARLDTLSQPTKELFTIAFAPDGKTLAAGGADNRIRLWQVTDRALEGSNKLLYARFGHEGSVLKLAFTPDGKTLVSTAADKSVKLWTTAELTERSVLEPQSDWASALALTTTGQLIIGRLDGTLDFYNATTGTALAPAAKKSALLVPQGRKKIAQHFSAGLTAHETSPAGTTEIPHTPRSQASVAPAGALSIPTPKPSAKALGYFQSSLRDLPLGAPISDPALLPVSSPKPAGSETGAPSARALRLLTTANRNPLFAQTAKNPAPKAAAKTAQTKAAADKKAAAAGKPVLTRLEPPAIQRGAISEIKLLGKNLADLTALKFSNPKLLAEILPADPAKPDEARVKITAYASLPHTPIEVSVITTAGESEKLKLAIDDLPQIAAPAPPKPGAPVALASLPLGIWGVLKEAGTRADFTFAARANQTLVFDLEARRIGSKAVTPALQLLDDRDVLVASNYGMENNTDPLLAFRVPRDARYTIRVSEVTLEGSADHTYHLTLGALPYVTGFFPISAGTNQEVEVTLAGYNLPAPTVRVTTAAPGKTKLPLAPAIRTRGTPELLVTDATELIETEPNNTPAQAQILPIPSSVNGRLFSSRDIAPTANANTAPDADLFAFDAKRGQQLVLETLAARAGSLADTKLEILFPNGDPVPRLRFQAVRDSWINFRRQDANAVGVRIANWEEMDLSQYVWFNGDIQRVVQMPRGPDADMIFANNNGKRRAYFDTTATAHALEDTCYVVEPRALDAKLLPNGLPVFTLPYANDDDGDRVLGADSKLHFTAPADGRYLVRVTDTRGTSGERCTYRLTIRPARPDFQITLQGANPTVAAGAGASFGFRADRLDGFADTIRIDIANLPAGFTVATPITIQPDRLLAETTLFAAPDAQPTDAAAWAKVKITATATIAGQTVTHDVMNLGTVKLGPAANVQIVLEPGGDATLKTAPNPAPERPLEITITPGETVAAWIRTVRHGNTNLVNLDISGLPFGVIVDNIGLNGVQVRAGESVRDIYLTAARWVPEQDRPCFAVTQSARNDAPSTPGTQTSFPVLLKVRKAATSAVSQK